MENILSLPSASSGLTAGSPDLALPGVGDSGPGGIESIFVYNGVYMNIREWIDTFLITQIDGLADPDVRDARDVNPGRHGETYFEAFYGGRTIVLTGKVRAHTINKLRDMQQGLRQAFSDLGDELPLIIRNTSFGRDMMISCKKSQPIQMAETQQGFSFTRDFQITLRASNPRFLSTLRKSNNNAFYTEDNFSTSAETQFTNLIVNPSFELNVANWTPTAGITATQGAAGTGVGGGTNRAAILTVTTAGQRQFGSAAFPVSAVGARVWASAAVMQTTGAARAWDISIVWYSDVAGTVFAGISQVGFGNTSGAYQTAAAAGIAPAGTKSARLYLTINSTAVSDVFRFDQAIAVESPNTPSGYFDGESAMGVWLGQPHASTSALLRGTSSPDDDKLTTEDEYAWQYDSASAGAYIPINGTLSMRAPAATERRIYRDDLGHRPTNVRDTLKITTPTDTAIMTGATGRIGHILKRIENDTYIGIELDYQGANINLRVVKMVDGVRTVLLSSSNVALSVNTSYWLQGSISGNTVTAKLFTQDPVINPAATPVTNGSISHTLSASGTPSDETRFGTGIPGDVGLYSLGLNQGWKLDDYVQETLDSVGLLTTTITNEGNFSAEPQIQLTGPMTNPAITNESTGQTMSFTGTIPAGQTWTIDAATRTIEDSNGVSKFDKLDITSEWIDIEPGDNPIEVAVTGMSATRAGIGQAVSGPGATINYYDTWM